MVRIVNDPSLIPGFVNVSLYMPLKQSILGCITRMNTKTLKIVVTIWDALYNTKLLQL